MEAYVSQQTVRGHYRRVISSTKVCFWQAALGQDQTWHKINEYCTFLLLACFIQHTHLKVSKFYVLNDPENVPLVHVDSCCKQHAS